MAVTTIYRKSKTFPSRSTAYLVLATTRPTTTFRALLLSYAYTTRIPVMRVEHVERTLSLKIPLAPLTFTQVRSVKAMFIFHPHVCISTAPLALSCAAPSGASESCLLAFSEHLCHTSTEIKRVSYMIGRVECHLASRASMVPGRSPTPDAR